jgi:hypothetical protein
MSWDQADLTIQRTIARPGLLLDAMAIEESGGSKWVEGIFATYFCSLC